MEELRNQDGCGFFFGILLCIYLVPAWVCNVSAGTDPPKCSLSLSHTDFLRTKLTIMLHFHSRPTVFKVDVLIISPWEKCRVELVICLMISIYETAELHSPLVPVCQVCVHQNWWSGSQRRTGVSQPGGALCDGRVGVFYTIGLDWCLRGSDRAEWNGIYISFIFPLPGLPGRRPLIVSDV